MSGFSKPIACLAAAVGLTLLYVVLSVFFSSGRPNQCFGGELLPSSTMTTTSDGMPSSQHVFHNSHPGSPSTSRFVAPQVEYRHPPPPRGGARANTNTTALDSDKEKKHYVITGGAGFIGSQLGYHLWSLGHEVTLIDNMAYGYRDNLEIPEQEDEARSNNHPAGNRKLFGRFVNADVRDPRIYKYLEGADVVFHFAALTALPVCQSEPLQTIEVNVAGTANVLEGVRVLGIKRLVFASTSAVYESNTEAVLTEELPVNPKLLYSLSKLQSEQLIHSYEAVYSGVQAVILRFFNVYGPHQDFRRTSPPLTSYLVRELLNRRTPILHSTGNQERDYVFVEDLLQLVITAAEDPKAIGQTINVASGTSISVNEIYRLISLELGAQEILPTYNNASSFWARYPVLFRGAYKIRGEVLEKEVNKHTLGSYAKAKDLLGWAPKVSMAQGLKRMVNFVKKHQVSKQKSQRGGGWGG